MDDENPPLQFSQWKYMPHLSQETCQYEDFNEPLLGNDSQLHGESSNRKNGLSATSQQLLDEVQLFPREKKKTKNQPSSKSKYKGQQSGTKSKNVRLIRPKQSAYASLRRLLLLSRLADPAIRTTAGIASIYSTEDFELLLGMRKNSSGSINNGQLAEMLLQCINEKTVRVPHKVETKSSLAMEEPSQSERGDVSSKNKFDEENNVVSLPETGDFSEDGLARDGQQDSDVCRRVQSPSRSVAYGNSASMEIEEDGINGDSDGDSQKTVGLDTLDDECANSAEPPSESPTFDKYFARADNF